MLIDTHAHLYFNQFDHDREDVINRALESGVQKIINIAVDVETARQCIEMAEQLSGLFAAVGVHPNDSIKFNDKILSELKELSRHPKVVATGEIGLDFYRDFSPVEIQKDVFKKQIRLAKEIGLPIVIHNRDAIDEILDILKSEGTADLSGVFHCFSENREYAEQVLELGFHISFTGNLTFKKSELPDVARAVPLNRLLLETDSPFLSPEPRRGRRNEPANVVYIAEKLAEIKKIEFDKLGKTTTANANKLFGL